MPQTYDLILRNADVYLPGGLALVDVGVRGGQIVALERLDPAKGGKVRDLRGLTILPGLIDSQVHFREPGMEHKEDLETGATAAVCGGITAVFEMPNTDPVTTTEAALADKLARAKGRMACDHAFFVGASPDNIDQLADLEDLPGSAGVKVFLGSSTGALLVEEYGLLQEVLHRGHRRASFHCEDEGILRTQYAQIAEGSPACAHPQVRCIEAAVTATTRLLRLAKQAKRLVHILHISTAEELALLAADRSWASCEATPHHLWLVAPDCYDRLGTRAQMNPPVREERHRAALWAAVQNGLIDVLGSDHAPHTLEEKARAFPAAPSGMPAVQTTVPLMLNAVHEGRLSLSRLVDLLASGPQRIFGIQNKGRIALGYDADFTIVDLRRRETIDRSWLKSRAGWSPYEGETVTGWPVMTYVRGTLAAEEGERAAAPQGKPVAFLTVRS